MDRLKNNKNFILIVLIITIILTSSFFIIKNIFNKNNVVINNKKDYLIKFNSNDGTEVRTQKIKNTTVAIRPNDPVKEGYLFVEWQLNGKIFDFSSPITEDLVLKAKWQKVDDINDYFVVKFESNGGTTISNQILKKGQKVVKPETPKKKNYGFQNWYLDNEKYNFDSVVTKNIVLYAIWNNTNVDTENQILVPLLHAENVEKYVYDFSLNYNAYFNDLHTGYIIDGFELYSVNSKNEYKYIKDGVVGGTISLQLYPNNVYNYAARAYKLIEGKKQYSEYSAVTKISLVLKKPTVTAKNVGNFIYDFNIDNDSYILDNGKYDIDGFELFSISPDNEYKYIKDGPVVGTAWEQLYPNSKYKYMARTFITIENKRYYSPFSSVIKLTPKIETPNLKYVNADDTGQTIDFSLNYDIYLINGEYIVDGWELYSVTGSDNRITYIKDGPVHGTTWNNVSNGDKYVARSFKIIHEKKYYSNYSNIVEVKVSQIKTPQLNYSDAGKFIYDFSLNYDTYYQNNKYIIDGWELYSVTGEDNKITYIKDGSIGGTTWIQLIPGNNYKYIARAYILKNEEKIYSSYSVPITINPIIPKPVLTYAETGNGQNVDFKVNNSDYYINNKYMVDGFELYSVMDSNTYNYIKDAPISGTTYLDLMVGKTYKYASRVFVIIDDKKYYSSYSSILKIVR